MYVRLINELIINILVISGKVQKTDQYEMCKNVIRRANTYTHVYLRTRTFMGLLPDTYNCVLRMRRDSRNVFPATAG